MSDYFDVNDLAIIALLLDEEEQTRRPKRFGVHKSNQKRKVEGEYWTLFKELMDDEERFVQYFRMSQHQFHILLNKIESSITKSDTTFKEAIGPKEKLSVCLRFLSTGGSFRTIALSYRLGLTTVANIVKEVCEAIIQNLLSQYMPQPSKEDWLLIAKDFFTMWNFPNCIGAIDGKHVPIVAPANSSSLLYNKNTFSVVLMALVDSNYKFIAVDVGDYGRNNDGGIFLHSKLGQCLENGKLNIPEDKALPNSDLVMPHVVVGGEAFPLKKYLLRPYPGKQLEQDPEKIAFNYRLSCARRVSENAFGILCQKFHLYNRRIQLKSQNVDKVIMTTCILHNYIIEGHNTIRCREPPEGTNLAQIPHQGGNATHSAFKVRDAFKSYFCSPAGQVDLQDPMQ